jgi:hypothetical protein
MTCARASAQRTLFWVAGLLAIATSLAVPFLLLDVHARAHVIDSYEFDPFGPLVAIAIASSAICIAMRPRRGFHAFAGALVALLLVVSFWVNPVMNESRSARGFIERVEAAADPSAPLGFVAFKEQYLLNVTRPVVHFGHARWREGDQEAMDAGRWMSGSPERQLVVNQAALAVCFRRAESTPLGSANRIQWYLVRGAVEPGCIRRGKPDLAHFYNPPTAKSVKISARHMGR